jgi:predicted GIY-YIG superfamily endonuclease
MIERVPCVYILASGYNGRLYTGVTSNLIGRVQQHRDGTFDGHTRKYGIHRLVYYEVFDTMEPAILRERRSGPRHEAGVTVVGWGWRLPFFPSSPRTCSGVHGAAGGCGWWCVVCWRLKSYGRSDRNSNSHWTANNTT